MYLVTRVDLPPAVQAVQVAHAAADFAVTYPGLTAAWRASSNTLVVVAAPNQAALHRLAATATRRGYATAIVQEPDLDWATTAVAVEPAGRRLVHHLPLAFREEVNTL